MTGWNRSLPDRVRDGSTPLAIKPCDGYAPVPTAQQVVNGPGITNAQIPVLVSLLTLPLLFRVRETKDDYRLTTFYKNHSA